MAKKKNNRKRTSGWAFTKWFPHVRHPARYKKKNATSDEVDYITFTHSDNITLPNGTLVPTIPLSENISEKERAENKGKEEKDKTKSYANPTVYSGKRSALGKEVKGLSLVPVDNDLVNKLFETLPVENVPKTSNTKQPKNIDDKK